MIDGLELTAPQQLGQLARVDAIALIPLVQQKVLARIANQQFGDVRLEQIYFERASRRTSRIDVHDLISDGTTLLDLVEILQRREFAFVLTHQRIDGYVHYSDLNHQVVKWTFYVMLEAVERLALESIRPADERFFIAEKLGHERYEQVERMYKRAGDNARSLLTYLNIADILTLAVKNGALHLDDSSIRLMKEVRDWAAHVLLDLAPETAFHSLETVKRECLRLLSDGDRGLPTTTSVSAS